MSRVDETREAEIAKLAREHKVKAFKYGIVQAMLGVGLAGHWVSGRVWMMALVLVLILGGSMFLSGLAEEAYLKGRLSEGAYIAKRLRGILEVGEKDA